MGLWYNTSMDEVEFEFYKRGWCFNCGDKYRTYYRTQHPYEEITFKECKYCQAVMEVTPHDLKAVPKFMIKAIY